MKIGRITVREENDILRVRQAVMEICSNMRFDHIDRIRITTAASELTRNIYEHAKGGNILFEILQKKPRLGLQMFFDDKGDGIKGLDRILAGEYQSATGMGVGLLGARELMDYFDIDSRPGKGTTVKVIKWLPMGRDLSKEEKQKIKNTFDGLSKGSALHTLKTQNRELIRVLDELQKKNVQVEAVNRELEVTNDGIISLYQELDKKNEELAAGSENKSTYLRSMGHEIRTPINSILIIARILLRRIDGDLTAEQEKQVTMIIASATHLDTLVNNLLDISRVEAGVLDTVFSTFTIGQLFARAEATILPLAKDKGLSLSFASEAKKMRISSDFKLVLQILLNILGNAVKYTEQGAISIVAGLHKDDKSLVEIKVRDTGIGIPVVKQKLIFEEFGQAHMMAGAKGTGLGLAIASKLSEHLGGFISVDSRVGKGSTFYLNLPIKYQTTEKTSVQATERPAESAKRETILLVEDDEKMLYSLRRELEANGYSIIAARTEEMAMEIIAKGDIFAVCLDICLPTEEKGWNILKQIKRASRTRNIPVLVITVLDKAEEKARALQADAYLAKPVDMKELIAKLGSYRLAIDVHTILVVDDEEAELLAFKSFLGARYQLLTASDGLEALQLLKKTMPDLIILDLIMPVMDGFEVIERLRKDEKLRHLPVIVRSSKDLTAREKKFLERETIDIINKGEVPVEEIQARIQNVIGQFRERKFNEKG